MVERFELEVTYGDGSEHCFSLSETDQAKATDEAKQFLVVIRKRNPVIKAQVIRIQTTGVQIIPLD